VSKMPTVMSTFSKVAEERDGLLQPQSWPVGLGPSGELEVFYPLDVCLPSGEIDEWDFPDPLDWEYDEGEDPALARLDTIEEDFHKEVRVARASIKAPGSCST
jgi:hypothetical protein